MTTEAQRAQAMIAPRQECADTHGDPVSPIPPLPALNVCDLRSTCVRRKNWSNPSALRLDLTTTRALPLLIAMPDAFDVRPFYATLTAMVRYTQECLEKQKEISNAKLEQYVGCGYRSLRKKAFGEIEDGIPVPRWTFWKKCSTTFGDVLDRRTRKMRTDATLEQFADALARMQDFTTMLPVEYWNYGSSDPTLLLRLEKPRRFGLSDGRCVNSVHTWMLGGAIERVDEDVLPACKRRRLFVNTEFTTMVPSAGSDFWQDFDLSDYY